MRWLVVAIVAVVIFSVSWWKISTRDVDAPAVADVMDNRDANGMPPSRHAARPVLPGSATPAELTRFNEARRVESKARVVKLVDIGRNKLTTRYQNEKVDNGWATGREQGLVENSVSPQIRELGAEPKNLAVHCRSSTCQVTADFPTRVAADDWFTLYLTNPGTNLSNASYQATANPDGTTHVEIFGLARQP